jgi:uncharacterized membrane protein
VVPDISEKRVDSILLDLTTIQFLYCLQNRKPQTEFMEKIHDFYSTYFILAIQRYTLTSVTTGSVEK